MDPTHQLLQATSSEPERREITEFLTVIQIPMRQQLQNWTFIFFLLIFFPLTLWGNRQPSYSTAGFYVLPETGRNVYSMNPAWRFHKGNAEGAERTDFNDKDWEIVSLPDGIEYLPTEASGCVNYQGEVWYRKHFTPEETWKCRNCCPFSDGIPWSV